MTHDQYWHESPWLAKTFYEAHLLKIEMENQISYMQGLYNFSAFTTALNNFGQIFSRHKRKPENYLEKPIRITPLTEEEKEAEQRKEQQKVIDFFSNLKSNLNANAVKK